MAPKGFVLNANMDATNARRYNYVFNGISTTGSATVEEATRALTTENGEIDPRSATTKLTTKPADGTTLVYIPTKDNAATLTAGEAIPEPIARYEEAQLILAEAQGGATDATSINSLIGSERQRVLFVEGFRAFDIERLNLALVPAKGTAYSAGGLYGSTVCLPLPDIERYNNPNIIVSQIISGVRGQFPIP